ETVTKNGGGPAGIQRPRHRHRPDQVGDALPERVDPGDGGTVEGDESASLPAPPDDFAGGNPLGAGGRPPHPADPFQPARQQPVGDEGSGEDRNPSLCPRPGNGGGGCHRRRAGDFAGGTAADFRTLLPGEEKEGENEGAGIGTAHQPRAGASREGGPDSEGASAWANDQ